MKIFEIAPSKLISEGRVDPNALMSVANVVNRGFANNTFEYIIIARFLQLLKEGRFYAESNPMFDPIITTCPILLAQLKAMPPEQISAVAAKLLRLLDIKNRDELSKYQDPVANYDEWLKLVSSHEAND